MVGNSKAAARGKELAARAASNPLAPRAAKRKLVEMSLARATVTQYKSALQGLRAFALASTGRREDDRISTARLVDKNILASFLVASVDLEPSKKLATIRSALRKELLVEGMRPWTDDEDVAAFFRGASFQGGHAPRALMRGTVTPQMLIDLIAHTHNTDPRFVDPITVQFGAALRVSQLVAARSGDFTGVGEDGRAYLWTEVDKRRNAKTMTKAGIGRHKKEVFLQEAQQALQRRQDQRPRGSLLFPTTEWRKAEYNAHIRRAALELQWPDGVNWDGCHILRHGGAAVLAEAAPTEAPARLVMSPRMVKHYGRPLHDRQGKASGRPPR